MGIARTVIGMVLGGLLTAWISEDPAGLLIGMTLGFLWARNSLRGKLLAQLEARLHALESRLQAQHQAAEQPLKWEIDPAVSEAAAMPPAEQQPDWSWPVQGNLAKQQPPNPLAAALAAKLKTFFTEGNVALRIGLLLLFFGVAFLLKYAADHDIISIELRLLAVALAGIALLGLGWRLRERQAGFALLVQGGGIGVLYLTAFAAFKLYQLLPAPLAFLIMLGLVGASAALALVQDARSLALFGAAGGFLAPVLLSEDSGNHVALFSYYALLNAGILAIAWFKAWRSLNLLGFFFTLGIGAIWGALSYHSEQFASTEPFLILFFLMFTGIGVLFAFRQPLKLRGYVDGTLVFGTPIVCFSFQAALVRNMHYGTAFSALLLSIFYVGLAWFLWRKGDERQRQQGMRTLTEAFLALGIGFATLAVPLALSGRWTAVTWAMEGAAVIWIGVRQNRIIPRNVGVLLQLAAGFFFFQGGFHSQRIPLCNGVYLGTVIIALSALFSSWQLYKADNLRRFERHHHLLLLCWGTLWWMLGGINEINSQFGIVHLQCQDVACLIFISLSCAVLMFLADRLSWRPAAWPSVGLLPLMILVVLHSTWNGEHFSAECVWLGWVLIFVFLHACLHVGRKWLRQEILAVNHVGGYLMLTLIASSETAWLIHHCLGTGCWPMIVWGLLPAGMILLVRQRRLVRFWPLSEYAGLYQQQGSGILAVLLWLWLLAGCFGSTGDPAPLAFLPLLNPLEVSQLAVMLLLCRWAMQQRAYVAACIPEHALFAAGAGTAFIWLNSALARAVHHLSDVPFQLPALLDSHLYQAALSIAWGLLSLLLMIAAERRQSRTIWLIGSCLIGATVGKLFLFDLAGSGTIARIVSFLAVGAVLMLIGYFSPLPPAKNAGEKSK